MFAIFSSDKMNPFYEIISSFPTVFFSSILLFCVLYWCIAVLGLVEIDAFDIDTPDLDLDTDNLTDLNFLAGLLLKLGLHGVPLTIIITLASLFGWFFSFFCVRLILPHVPSGIMEFIASTLILIGSLYIAARLTALVIRPLRPIFLATNQETRQDIIGQAAVVRTGKVNQTFGEAFLEDGGAGLILKVRSYKDEEFKRGDRVIPIEYDDTNNTYKVISEIDFKH